MDMENKNKMTSSVMYTISDIKTFNIASDYLHDAYISDLDIKYDKEKNVLSLICKRFTGDKILVKKLFKIICVYKIHAVKCALIFENIISYKIKEANNMKDFLIDRLSINEENKSISINSIYGNNILLKYSELRGALKDIGQPYIDHLTTDFEFCGIRGIRGVVPRKN